MSKAVDLDIQERHKNAHIQVVTHRDIHTHTMTETLTQRLPVCLCNS